MKLKRIPLIILLTLIMVLQGALGLSAFAQSTVSLTAGDVSGAPGETVEVPVTLTSAGEVSALQFDISYDSSLLTYKKYIRDTLTNATDENNEQIFNIATNNLGDKFRVIIYSFTNKSMNAGTDTVVRLQFEVNAEAHEGDICSLDLSGVLLSDAQAQEITTTVNNGQFVVPQPPDSNIIRFVGVNRVETAGNLASYLFEGGNDTVIIAESRKMADSMIGTILAGALEAPILLVDKQTDLDNYSILKEQIENLKPNEAYLLGGTSVVPDEIATYLHGKGCTVKRIAGDDRFDTAVEIIKEVIRHDVNIGNTLYVANGRGQTDANGLMLAAEGYALAPSADVARHFNPVLLVDKKWNSETKAARVNDLIENAGLNSITKCIILGGTDQVPESVVNVLTAKLNNPKITREEGDVYTVSAKLAEAYATDNVASDVVIARGDILADALSGGLLAAEKNAPLIFVNTDIIPEPADNAIKMIVNEDSKAYILGSTSAVSYSVAEKINKMFN